MTTPLPNDDDDITWDDDDSGEPGKTCEVTINPVSDDPNAARPESAFDMTTGETLDESGEGMGFQLDANSPVGVVLTGAQRGEISRLAIAMTGDCGDLTLYGELLIDQSNPFDPSVIDATQAAWSAGDTFTTLAYDPKTGVFTANAPHDQNGEVWVVTRTE